jgi:hypothetical protein
MPQQAIFHGTNPALVEDVTRITMLRTLHGRDGDQVSQRIEGTK